MTVRDAPRVLVAGAGAVGLCLALELARAGARVSLADPAAPGLGASGVAAGMLAPAFETLFDEDAPDLMLLRRARDLWPALSLSIDLRLERSGAMAVGRADDVDHWALLAAARGVPVERVDQDETAARAAWLRPGLRGLWTEEDWRLDPAEALAALAAALEAEGVRRIHDTVVGFSASEATLAAGEVIGADALVVATGAGRSLMALAPELERIAPIKGHILRFPGLEIAGPVARFEGGYICPASGGLIVGATMEPGREDGVIELVQVRRLVDAAAVVMPALQGAPWRAATGIRGATPDGLPIVGRSENPGVWIAAGARRNGWLLAPLIARGLGREIMEALEEGG